MQHSNDYSSIRKAFARESHVLTCYKTERDMNSTSVGVILMFRRRPTFHIFCTGSFILTQIQLKNIDENGHLMDRRP